MEPSVNSTRHERIEHNESSVHVWRVSQLRHLGIPVPLAEHHADHLDWHELASRVRRGCPPLLALRIVR